MAPLQGGNGMLARIRLIDFIRFQHFHVAGCVPVPLRLYYKNTAAQPLASVRVTIKDNMHLAGVTTGLGNRAYAALYDKQKVTSKYVQSLIDKGAIIIGKTKLSAFAGSEIPPNQCIDYFPPWNPRAGTPARTGTKGHPEAPVERQRQQLVILGWMLHSAPKVCSVLAPAP